MATDQVRVTPSSRKLIIIIGNPHIPVYQVRVSKSNFNLVRIGSKYQRMESAPKEPPNKRMEEQKSWIML